MAKYSLSGVNPSLQKLWHPKKYLKRCHNHPFVSQKLHCGAKSISAQPFRSWWKRLNCLLHLLKRMWLLEASGDQDCAGRAVHNHLNFFLQLLLYVSPQLLSVFMRVHRDWLTHFQIFNLPFTDPTVNHCYETLKILTRWIYASIRCA